MPDWVAELKGELAKLGHEIQPGFDVTYIDKPKGPATIVILDRVKEELPDYCTHGYATCIGCDHPVWLGSETFKTVKEGEAFPVCLECATEHIPSEEAVRLKHIKDHLREDGPHEGN